MTSISPTGITADRLKSELTVTWSDGHISVYPLHLLRFGCPCVTCRGGHEYMGSEPDQAVFDRPAEDSPATRISRVEAVGAYGITIEWEDGHHYGIYNWHYLRALCPCQACRYAEDHER